jgi:hypothetical protein
MRSRWREFSFALTEVTKAIQPPLALGSMMRTWKEIAEGLAEPPRARTSQIEKYEALTNQTS